MTLNVGFADQLVADGGRAAVLVRSDWPEEKVAVIWSPGAGVVRVNVSSFGDAVRIALTAHELGWESALESMETWTYELASVGLPLRSPSDHGASVVWGSTPKSGPVPHVDPIGDRDTIVYWNAGHTQARTCTHRGVCVTRTVATGRPKAIGGAYVAVASGAHVRIVQLDGTTVRTVPMGLGYAFAGRRIVVQTEPSKIRVYPLRRSAPPEVIAIRGSLADAEPELVALVESTGVRLLSLSTRRTHFIRVRAPLAQIEPEGLYYASNSVGGRRGRVTFVPMRLVREWLSA